MDSIELTRLGIIFTMASFLFISPEVIYRARELAWVDNIHKSIKFLILNAKNRTIAKITRSYQLEVKQQLEQALETGRPTKLLLKVAVAHLIPLVSLVVLVLSFHGYLHISLGIIAGVFTLPYVFVSIVDVFAAHGADAKSGNRVSFLTNLKEHLLFPPMIYLYLCAEGILWPPTFIIIILSSKSVRSWLAVIGIAMFFTGQVLQLTATYY